MTQLDISFEEAKKLALVELKWFQQRGVYAKVMGGFVRDSFLGKPVKDMDIYLETDEKVSLDDIKKMADDFYKARGHEYILHKSKQMEGAEESPYNTFMTVFSSVNVPEGDFGVDLIFPPSGYSHTGEFDIALCETSLGLRFGTEEVRHYQPESFMKDVQDKTLTVQRVEDGLYRMLNGYKEQTDEQFEVSFKRMCGHLDRLKEKYPDHNVVVNISGRAWDNVAACVKLYNRLKEEDYIGETGEILPTEAGLAERDAVRQLDREELVRAMQGNAGTRVQARPAPVQDRAQVQPGLFDWNTANTIVDPEMQERMDRALAALQRAQTQLQQDRARTQPRAEVARPTQRNTGPRDAFGNPR